MSLWAVAPIAVPLATAMLTALVARRRRLQAAVGLAGALAGVATAVGGARVVALEGAQRVALGAWPAPFGIELLFDATAALLVVVTAIIGLATVLSLDVSPPTTRPLVFGLLAGVGGAFTTGDLFNLYVWFEVILIGSLGLLALGTRTDQRQATLKALVLGVFGTLVLLLAVGLIYAATGHLNYAALAAAPLAPSLALPLLATLAVALLAKAGAFPLFMWLPASYPALPAPVLALFAGLLTKVGVYALLRTLGGVFDTPAVLLEAVGWVGVATMIAGVLGAAWHWDLRRILAFHIISQIGYLLVGVSLATPSGHAATLFYTVHHIVVKANLFLVAGLIAVVAGSSDLRRVGGLLKTSPLLAAAFLVPGLSLVGVPPLSGFWSKYLILQELLAQGRFVWAAAALAVSALTLYSVLKIWMEAFWKPHPHPTKLGAARPGAWVAVGLLALVTLALSLAPDRVITWTRTAAGSLAP